MSPGSRPGVGQPEPRCSRILRIASGFSKAGQIGLVAVTFLVNAAHGLGGDRMSWRILVSVSTSTVQKWSFLGNQIEGATPVMDMAP